MPLSSDEISASAFAASTAYSDASLPVNAAVPRTAQIIEFKPLNKHIEYALRHGLRQVLPNKSMFH